MHIKSVLNLKKSYQKKRMNRWFRQLGDHYVKLNGENGGGDKPNSPY